MKIYQVKIVQTYKFPIKNVVDENIMGSVIESILYVPESPNYEDIQDFIFKEIKRTMVDYYNTYHIGDTIESEFSNNNSLKAKVKHFIETSISFKYQKIIDTVVANGLYSYEVSVFMRGVKV